MIVIWGSSQGDIICTKLFITIIIFKLFILLFVSFIMPHVRKNSRHYHWRQYWGCFGQVTPKLVFILDFII